MALCPRDYDPWGSSLKRGRTISYNVLSDTRAAEAPNSIQFKL